MPVIPVIGHTSRSWTLKNWHTFYISKPFSKTKLVIGEPIYFSKDQSIEECLDIVKKALVSTDKEASLDA